MAHKVICSICGQSFDRDKEPWVQDPSNKRRYVHKDCYESFMESRSQEDKDKDALEAYIKQLYKVEEVPRDIQRQIKEYVEKDNYSYSGILKTLKYHYEVKHGDINKSNGRITIVKYVYQDAYRYYLDLWQSQQQSQRALELEGSISVPEQIEVHIQSPQRKVMGRKKNPFSFLDEEGRG